MPPSNKRPTGFTLVEVLIAVAVLGILAGVVLTRFEPTQHDQLMGTANLLVGDLSAARTLAVTNDTQYRVTFDGDENQYVLTHSGTNSTFDNLPDSPFHLRADDDDEQTTDLDDLPHLGARVEIVAVLGMTAAPATTEYVEFDGMGGTTTAAQTVIYLACGAGSERRYVTVEVNPVTGLATLGDFQAAGPPLVALD